jgi:hypothetical protein
MHALPRFFEILAFQLAEEGRYGFWLEGLSIFGRFSDDPLLRDPFGVPGNHGIGNSIFGFGSGAAFSSIRARKETRLDLVELGESSPAFEPYA